VRIVPMTRDLAEQVTTWTYPPPYDSNDMTGADPDFMADPASLFFALLDGAEELVGFRSFGADGQVPGGPYGEPGPAGLDVVARGALVLDTGGGLRPDLTGRGLGRLTTVLGLQHGLELFQPEAYRMTIADSNERALRVAESVGFARVAEFDAAVDGMRYLVLTARVPDLRLDG
jgi:ribosomal-protein-alanine N-acetyltransferase